jgi:CheY-like chemotaxis protein
MGLKKHIKGALGIYCPILMYHDQGSPFVDEMENENCPICGTWALADQQHKDQLELPPFSMESLKREPAHVLDFLLGGRKILLVEDNLVSMKVLTKSLAPLSSVLLQAKNGEEALDLIVDNPDIGLIMLDMNMPVMDGSTFMGSLNDQYGEQLPFAVMLVSELSNWQEARSLIDQGVLAYVKKPFGKKELYTTATQCLLQITENKPFNLV